MRRSLALGQSLGICFDIDGVLVRGRNVIGGAKQALQSLTAANVPYIFLTNGGGVPEATKAAQLESTLGVPVQPDQVIITSTPLKNVVPEYADKRVLVVGCKDTLTVAKSYGLQHAVTAEEVARDTPTIFPWFHFPHTPLPSAVAAGAVDEEIHAVFQMYDSIHWALDVQVALDVIVGKASPDDVIGTGSGAQTVPVFVCNPDLMYADEYPAPRLAAGAFQEALSLLYHKITGEHLAMTKIGKPLEVTFDYARQALGERRRSLMPDKYPDPAAPFDRILMIGDNPRADIRGANLAGDPWRSVLVRTGVFNMPVLDNDPVDPAHALFDDVGKAVASALSGEDVLS